MACSGPNCDYAAAQGDKAYDEILVLLREKYHLDLDFVSSFSPLLPKAKEGLREALREVFVAEACDTW